MKTEKKQQKQNSSTPISDVPIKMSRGQKHRFRKNVE